MPEIPPDGPLWVLHWNIHSWHAQDGNSNAAAVADLIRQTAPHVVSLVEVDETWGSPGQLSDLAGRCGYSWLFTPAFEFGNGKLEGGFGNALLTTLPILAAHQWQLLWPPQLYDRTESSEPRALLLACLGWPGTPFWAGTSHLPREDEQARDAALERLQTLTGALLEPWFVASDFNTPASSWLDPAAPVAVSAPLMTYPASAPAEPIDYCIASPGFQLDAEVLDSTASDHLPLLITASQPRRLAPRPAAARRAPVAPWSRAGVRGCAAETSYAIA